MPYLNRLYFYLVLVVLSVYLLPVSASTKKHFYNNGDVLSTVEINNTTENGPVTVANDYYGIATANIGDLDGDGIQDLAVAAMRESSQGSLKGAVYIHYLNRDGSVKGTVKIDDSTTNGPVLTNEDYYGQGITGIGDLDGDGTLDLAVGAIGDDNGGSSRGAVHIHFMNRNGSIKSTVEINDSTTNGPDLTDSDNYGSSTDNIGDLDGDGINDLVVGAAGDDNGGSGKGAVHIHFMNQNGSIKSTVEINDSTEDGPVLTAGDFYGRSVANIGDLDGDGIQDLAVGTIYSDSGGQDRGTIYIHFLNRNGSVKSTVKIDGSTTKGPVLNDIDYYGISITSIGDLDMDGIQEIAVGAYGDDNGGNARGTVHIHFMNRNGSIKNTMEINTNTPNGPLLSTGDMLGYGISSIGDLNNDGIRDLVVGATGDDAGGSNKGAVHILFMKPYYTLTFLKDTSCKDREPEETTWIQLEPKDNGMNLTWTQYDSQHVRIRIDDGTGNYPWEMSKASNDGHEFLPNVASWQKIKLRVYYTGEIDSKEIQNIG